MSGTPQQIGLQAVFDTKNFVAGAQTYIDTLDRMVQHTRVAATSMFVQPQIIGLTKMAQDVQDVVYQSRLLRTEFQKLGKQQTPFSQITPHVNAYRVEVRKAALDSRAFGNTLHHVNTNARSAAAGLATTNKQASALGRAMAGIQANAKNLNVTLNATATTARRAGTAFQTGVGVIFGTAVLHGIRGFTEGFINMSTAIAENIGFWERLTVSISFFESRSLDANAQTLSYASRVAMVGEKARETTHWIQQLAVESPFTSKEVGNIFRVAQAYGLTAETAKEILPLMLDLGSAAGLDADTLERVALAMGQVQARGKLTGEEIRQLGNAGIPIRDILVKQLGIANEDFEDLVENGAFTADVVIPRIIDSLRQFKGASEEVTANTLTGLANAMRETFEIGQVDLFQGVADSIKATMQEINRELQNPEFRPRLVALGQLIGKVFVEAIREAREAIAALGSFMASISPEVLRLIGIFALGVGIATALAVAFWLINAAMAALLSPVGLAILAFGALFTMLAQDDPLVALADFFKGLARMIAGGISALGRFADGVARMMHDFVSSLDEGADGIVSFGELMLRVFANSLEAGFSAVASVLQGLGSLISFWLEPHSPPRITPNLDKWGTEAANIYLEGWTKADFGILKDLGGMMRDFLSSLVKPGDLQGEVTVIEQVIGSRTLLQQAIDQIREMGQVSADTFAKIRASAGAASSMIIGYLERYQVLAAATKAVEVAQNALNAITAKYTALLKPLQERLEAINETQKVAEETKEIARLQSIIASKYVTDARKKSAALELETLLLEQQIRQTENQQETEEGAAEAALTAAEDQQTAAEDALEVYEEQIQLTIEANQLEQDRVEAIKAVADEAERLRKEKEKELTPLERQLEIYKLQQEELRGMIEIFRAKQVLADADATAAEKAAAQLTIQREQGESILRGFEIAKLGGSLAAIREIQIVMADITKGGGDEGSPFDAIVTDAAALEEEARKIKEELAEWDRNVKKFKKSMEATFDSFVAKVHEVNNNLPPFLKLFTGQEKTKEMSSPGGGLFANTQEQFFDFETFPILDTAAWVAGGLVVVNVLGKVGKALGGLWTVWKLFTGGGGATGAGTSPAGGLFTSLFGITGTQAWIGISMAIAGVGTAISGLWLTVSTGLSMAAGAVAAFLASLSLVTVGILAVVAAIAVFFVSIFLNIGGFGDRVKEWLNTTAEDIGKWWEETKQGFKDWATGIAEGIGDWLTEHIDFAQLKQVGTDIVSGLLGFDPFVVARLVGEAGQLIVDKFKEWMGIASPSTKMKDEVGTPMLLGIVQGFIDNISEAITDITGKIGEIIAAIVDPTVLQEWTDTGTQLAAEIITGITNSLYDAKDTIWETLEWIRVNVFDSEMFTRFRNKASQLGTTIMHGIHDGITAAIELVRGAVNTILALFPQWLQDWFLGNPPPPTPEGETPPPSNPNAQSVNGAEVPTKSTYGSLNDSIQRLNQTILMRTLPTQQSVVTPAGVSTGTTVYNYNLTTRTNAPSTSIVRDFNLLRAMAGA